MVTVKRFILPVLVILLFYPMLSSAGSIETRISNSMIQSFLESAFPITFSKEVIIMGAAKIPVTIQLSNPRTVLLSKSPGDKKPFLQVNMDYAISGITDANHPIRGHIAGDMNLAISQDHENLVLSMEETYLPVILPSLKISLNSIVKPIKIPIFRGFPVKSSGQEIYARFSNITIGAEDNYLIIRSDVTFEKKPAKKGE